MDINMPVKPVIALMKIDINSNSVSEQYGDIQQQSSA